MIYLNDARDLMTTNTNIKNQKPLLKPRTQLDLI